MNRKPLTYEEALERAAGLCSRAEHSAVEIGRKLRRWGVDADSAGKIAEWLSDNGFIDEERFARAFVHDKYRFDGWGRIKIRHALRQHGVAADVAEAAMSEVDEEEYLSVLRGLLAAKCRVLGMTDPYKKKIALFRFAASRGFEPGIVSSVAGDLVEGADDFDENVLPDGSGGWE